MGLSYEEAIEIIEIARSEVEWEYPIDYTAAFDKAIETLKEKAEERKNVSQSITSPKIAGFLND